MNEYLQSQSSFVGELLRNEYQRLIDSGEREISPENMAGNVYLKLDPEAVSPDIVKSLTICELMQRSRSLCRARQILEEAEHESRQGNLFQLQLRYPVTREGRDVYVLREDMKHGEYMENADRLRAEGQTKIRHADALLAEVDRLVSTGQLLLPMPEIQTQQGYDA